jgi:hypothetical protein
MTKEKVERRNEKKKTKKTKSFKTHISSLCVEPAVTILSLLLASYTQVIVTRSPGQIVNSSAIGVNPCGSCGSRLATTEVAAPGLRGERSR